MHKLRATIDPLVMKLVIAESHMIELCLGVTDARWSPMAHRVTHSHLKASVEFQDLEKNYIEDLHNESAHCINIVFTFSGKPCYFIRLNFFSKTILHFNLNYCFTMIPLSPDDWLIGLEFCTHFFCRAALLLVEVERGLFNSAPPPHWCLVNSPYSHPDGR